MSESTWLTQQFAELENPEQLDYVLRVQARTVAESMVDFRELIDIARTRQIHAALGFASWTAYVADVIDKEMGVLPVDDRRRIVGLLASEGMSQRAIAEAVGVSQSTIRDDLKSDDEVSRNYSPDATVTGLDGKSYPARPEPKPTPTPTPEPNRPTPEPYPPIPGPTPEQIADAVKQRKERDAEKATQQEAFEKAFSKYAKANGVFRAVGLAAHTAHTADADEQGDWEWADHGHEEKAFAEAFNKFAKASGTYRGAFEALERAILTAEDSVYEWEDDDEDDDEDD